jgi:hypothetical protein
MGQMQNLCIWYKSFEHLSILVSEDSPGTNPRICIPYRQLNTGLAYTLTYLHNYMSSEQLHKSYTRIHLTPFQGSLVPHYMIVPCVVNDSLIYIHWGFLTICGNSTVIKPVYTNYFNLKATQKLGIQLRGKVLA